MTDFDSSHTHAPTPSEPPREPTTVGADVAAHVAKIRHELLQQQERGPDGKWVAGTLASGDLLDRSQQLAREIAPMREDLADSLLADLGETREDTTQAQLMVARDIALLSLMEENLVHAELENAKKYNRVPFTTAKGRTATVVARLLAVMDRKLKLIQLIGLERRAKRVPSLSEVMDVSGDAHGK